MGEPEKNEKEKPIEEIQELQLKYQNLQKKIICKPFFKLIDTSTSDEIY